jgi:predicted nuclease of predicted toxin-antitoxin system
LIVTEDKDFGELVFAHGYKCSVLLIRYNKPNYEEVSDTFKDMLINLSNQQDDYFRFVVWSKNNTRVRKFF